MKKRWGFLLLVVALVFFIYQKPSDSLDTVQGPALPPPQETLRKPNADTPAPKTETLKKTPQRILSYIPTQAPSSLKKRWSHIMNFEDEEYLGSQLTLDGKAIENFYFRWGKDSSGNPTELIAGVLPQVSGVKGSFPSPQEIEGMAEDAATHNPADILFREEVWKLDSKGVLKPEIKMEVQTKSRSGRSAGHEIWMIDATTGEIVNRYDANRH